ncbi:ABC transporter permease [Omnitrophica bacterium]|nr:ABC transporter permease [Candidatus Omnitrophota bacterium]
MEYTQLIRIAFTSLWVSGTSVTIAALVGLPLAFIIAGNRFIGKKALITVLNTLMSLPTVVVGLLVYSFLCKKGLLGNLGLLYTPYAMIIGQFILASPIITALTISAIEGADERIEKTALTLGATRFQALLTLGAEMRIAILAAVVAGFGRVFAEIGVSMMLGGNIKNYTRNITTAIAFETAKGEFSLGIALGIILLLSALLINLLFQLLARRRSEAI